MNTPGYRYFTTFALWFALIVEAVWIFRQRFAHHVPWVQLGQPLIFLALFAVLAVLRGRAFWYPLVIRIFFAYEFGSAVADRFGWLGPPGTGVAWGDFAHFVAYTHQVNSFLPVGFALPLALIATVLECTFAVTLLLGIGTRAAGVGAAILLCLFGSAMTASGMAQGQFYYAVFLLAAGALFLSSIDSTWLSIDQMRAPKNAKGRPVHAGR